MALLAADQSLWMADRPMLPRTNHATTLVLYCEYHLSSLSPGGSRPTAAMQRDLRALVRIVRKHPTSLKAAWEVVIVHEVMES